MGTINKPAHQTVDDVVNQIQTASNITGVAQELHQENISDKRIHEIAEKIIIKKENGDEITVAKNNGTKWSRFRRSFFYVFSFVWLGGNEKKKEKKWDDLSISFNLPCKPIADSFFKAHVLKTSTPETEQHALENIHKIVAHVVKRESGEKINGLISVSNKNPLYNPREEIHPLLHPANTLPGTPAANKQTPPTLMQQAPDHVEIALPPQTPTPLIPTEAVEPPPPIPEEEIPAALPPQDLPIAGNSPLALPVPEMAVSSAAVVLKESTPPHEEHSTAPDAPPPPSIAEVPSERPTIAPKATRGSPALLQEIQHGAKLRSPSPQSIAKTPSPRDKNLAQITGRRAAMGYDDDEEPLTPRGGVLERNPAVPKPAKSTPPQEISTPEPVKSIPPQEISTPEPVLSQEGGVPLAPPLQSSAISQSTIPTPSGPSAIDLIKKGVPLKKTQANAKEKTEQSGLLFGNIKLPKKAKGTSKTAPDARSKDSETADVDTWET